MREARQGVTALNGHPIPSVYPATSHLPTSEHPMNPPLSYSARDSNKEIRPRRTLPRTRPIAMKTCGHCILK